MKIFWLIKAYLRLRIIKPIRYRALIREMMKNRSRTIVEVGIYKGRNSKRMIETAKAFHKQEKVVYHGFDLFEMLSETESEEEFSKSTLPYSEFEIKELLVNTGVDLNLYKGYSQDTLKQFAKSHKGQYLDFIFIDGGHKIETIYSDWNHLKQLMNLDTIVIFDDYYLNTNEEVIGKGCNELIDTLDRDLYSVEFLEPINEFEHPWGILRVQFVKVTLKNSSN